jgi:selenophosphate synthetase-related protein
LLTCPPDRVAECLAAFGNRGLTAAPVGVLDSSGLVRLARGTERATVFDLNADGVTNLRGR